MIIKSKKIIFLFFALIIVNTFLHSSTIYNESKYYEVESFYLNTGVELDYLTNRTNDGWIYDADYKYKNDGTKNSTSWKNFVNSKLSVEGYLNYSKKIKGMFLLDFYGSDYDSLWRPINDANKKTDKNQSVSLKKFEFNIKDYFYHVRYFQGIPHYNWKYEGDAFGFYPEQFETEKYLNIGGEPAPMGVEVNYDVQGLGDLDVVYGEPVWDRQNSVYAKQKFDIGYFKNYFLYRRERIPWEVSYGEQYKNSYALSSELGYLFPFDMRFGVMYQPFRVDKEYIYYDKVAVGTGYLGSKYLKKTAKTSSSDAFGYDFKVDSKNCYFFDYVALDYKYLGILAGNKQEYNLSMDKIFDNFMLNLDVVDTDPIIDANPLIYDGTEDDFGQAYLSPRSEISPFRVDEDNRKKTTANITLSYFYSLFNPTLLYNYDMGKMEDWNLNKEDNVIFACGLNYSLQKYNGTTDALYYYDKDGNVVWEGLGDAGLWEPKDPLNVVSFFCKGRYNEDWYYNLFIQTGDSIANGAFAHNDTSSFTPITNFLDTDLGIGYKKYLLNLKYSENNWGFEEWHRKFGITYDHLYKAELSRDFGPFGIFGLSYLNVYQNKYNTEIIEIPSFEEFMLKWTYKFERIFLFAKKDNKKNKDKRFGSQEEDLNPPIAKVSIKDNKILSLNEDGINDKINFNIYVKDESDIYDWNIVISKEGSQSKDVLFKKTGYGDVPSFFEWTIDSVQQIRELNKGKYYIKLTVTDIFGNTTESKPEFFDIYNYIGILNKNITNKLLKNSDVLIIENQNYLQFQYKLNDIYNTSEESIDKKMLDLLDVLNNEKVMQVKIITYTDIGRTSLENKNISKKISSGIANLFTSYGLKKDIIETIGLPLAGNVVNLKDDSVEIICYYNEK
jgi:hypothetical protein